MSEPDQRVSRDDILELILDKVRQDRYPSYQQINLLQEHLTNGEERDRLVEVLFEKVSQDRYPSMEMIRRLLWLTGL